MTPEEIEAKRIADEQAAAEAAANAIDPRDEKIARLEEERDNYKSVALKRLGKLPGDAEFLSKEEADKGLTVEEIVKKTLLDNEIAREKQAKEEDYKRILKENAELRLAAKNKPGASTVGGGSGASTEVKDNVFSEAQLVELRKRATRLKVDPEVFVANAKKNFSQRG